LSETTLVVRSNPDFHSFLTRNGDLDHSGFGLVPGASTRQGSTDGDRQWHQSVEAWSEVQASAFQAGRFEDQRVRENAKLLQVFFKDLKI